MSKLRFAIGAIAVCTIGVIISEARGAALGTEFTYQAQLKKNGQSVNDSCDMDFTLYDAGTSGTQVAATSESGVAVADGLFEVVLDFGTGVFVGDALWLEVAVQCSGDASPVNLSPRQPVTAAPQALFSLSAASASWSGLTDGPAGFADGTDDDTLATLSCSTDQVAKWNGGLAQWECADDNSGAGGGFTNMQVFSTAGSSNFTVPAGVTKVMVEVRGGGGGGGGSS